MSTHLNIPNLAQVTKDSPKVGEAFNAVQNNANQTTKPNMTGQPRVICTPTQRPG